MCGLCCLQVTKEEYQKVGSLQLGRQLEAELRAKGRNPYIIAVGGSTPLGEPILVAAPLPAYHSHQHHDFPAGGQGGHQ